MVIVIESISEMQSWVASQIASGKTIGFVPTMGALHAGHKQLVVRAEKENEVSVCSIFVNPTQFNNPTDLEKYPRTFDTDKAILNEAGCDVIFFPSEKEMYPEGRQMIPFDLQGLDTVMEGRFRPGHFAGVVTVVKKLFDAVPAHRAYFGEKDFQQLAIIRFMTQAFQLPIQIIGCPTIRETDGLAYSSRNIHLTPEERKAAPLIYQSISNMVHHKNSHSVNESIQATISEINATQILKVEYLDVVDAQTLQTVSRWSDAPILRVCIAVFTSKTRLIDNCAC
ncbi:MAG: pantoate--beta-alanine ligase [Bacteroidetes bacterium]|nr:pantoate--beta-alanine ligase [Bacteroidota bacterium]